MASAVEVIAAVAASAGDLGMFRSDQGAQAGAWWMALADPSAPKIIARLPFIERRDHPAGTPVFVVAKPLADAAARERVLICVTLERWRAAIPSTLADLGAAVISSAATPNGLSLLIEGPGLLSPKEAAAALSAGGSVGHERERGRVARRALQLQAASEAGIGFEGRGFAEIGEKSRVVNAHPARAAGSTRLEAVML